LEETDRGIAECDGLLAKVINGDDNCGGKAGISVEGIEDVLASTVPPKEEKLLNALGVLAHELEHRRAELTKSFVDLNDQESEEYKPQERCSRMK
jgi:hypothetical protein